MSDYFWSVVNYVYEHNAVIHDFIKLVFNTGYPRIPIGIKPWSYPDGDTSGVYTEYPRIPIGIKPWSYPDGDTSGVLLFGK